jgi:DNA oxidative demethylase
MNLIAAKHDLFGELGLAGPSQAGALVTPSEEQVLIGSIDAAKLSPFRFHGSLGKRLTASYGWRYDFDDASFAPTERSPIGCCRFGAVLRPATGRARPAAVDPLRPGCGNRLAPRSAGVRACPWHIARRPAAVDLSLTGEAHHDWEHSITAMEVTRWSITFCSLSKRGRLQAMRT